MDFSVPPDSRTARLPRPLQPLAVIGHRLYMEARVRVAGDPEPRPAYVFEADGLATAHFSPFLEDREWSRHYDEMAREWYLAAPADVRWRMWLMTSYARHCGAVEGGYAEFGTYRGGCAYMLLATGCVPSDRRLFLFDTFYGHPPELINEAERAAGLDGAHEDTSVEYVAGRLAPWRDQIEIVAGDVIETLQHTDTGRLAFVHMDLNLAKPTQVALEYVYPRLSPGAIIVFDDYGGAGLETQRAVVDEFFAGRTERVVALPSGQGMLIKH
jgi:predicted O-methyltransferase YrrM